MNKIVPLASWENNSKYQIDKITDNDHISIIFRSIDKHPYGVISIIRFPEKQGLDSLQMMNWENLIRCSNYYGYPPEETRVDGSLGYMAEAVQKGLKPAATFRRSFNDQIVKELISTLPKDCLIVPFKEEGTTYICRDCKLSDIYNLSEIKKRYDMFDISNIDWNKVGAFFEKELLFFSDNNASDIFIERGARDDTERVIIGALLGYPIESTVAAIQGTYQVFTTFTPFRCRAIEHFKQNEDPYVDTQKNTWYKMGQYIYCEMQKEELYY